jgi:deoxyhypusine synthase
MEIAAILDPRFKMILIQFFFFSIIYQEVEAIKNIEYVEKNLNEIYDVYVNEQTSNAIEQHLLSNVQECSSGNNSISTVAGSV